MHHSMFFIEICLKKKKTIAWSAVTAIREYIRVILGWVHLTMSSVQLISLYLWMNSAELLLCPWGDSRGHLHEHDEWITNEKKLKSKAPVHFNNWARELDQNSLSWSDSFEAHTGKGEEMQRYGPVAPKHRHLSCYTPELPSSSWGP